MHTVEKINFAFMCLFFACYLYQFLYIPLSWLPAKKSGGAVPLHRFAVLIAARNEEAVIGNLIDSIKAQSYPARLIQIFVVADNCRDATAHIARVRGATVFERRDSSSRGKGYALDFLLRQMRLHRQTGFDAYVVLDADNVLDRNFFASLNVTFSRGHDIVTCYRNSKNFGDNWISAGYGLWFLREARYLNQARMRLGSSCGVSGTGFLFSAAVLARQGGGGQPAAASGVVCSGAFPAPDATEPVSDAVCDWRHYHGNRVAAHSLPELEKAGIPVHLPAVHAELYSHCDPIPFRHAGMDTDPAHTRSECPADLR